MKTGDDPMEFSKKMAGLFGVKWSNSIVVVKKPLELDVIEGPNQGALINLERIFHNFQRSAKNDRQELIDDFVNNLEIDDQDWNVDALRIIVRDQQYFDYVEGINFSEELGSNPFVSKQIGDDLYALLALEAEKTISLASGSDLESFDLMKDQAWEIARKNSLKFLPAVPSPDDIGESTILLEGENFLATSLFNLGDWQKLREQVGECLFVTALTDQTLMVGLLENGQTLQRLKSDLIDESQYVDRCVTPHVYRMHRGFWKLA